MKFQIFAFPYKENDYKYIKSLIQLITKKFGKNEILEESFQTVMGKIPCLCVGQFSLVYAHFQMNIMAYKRNFLLSNTTYNFEGEFRQTAELPVQSVTIMACR